MKKYLISAALFCAMLLTSCGTASDNAVEVSLTVDDITASLNAEVTDKKNAIDSNDNDVNDTTSVCSDPTSPVMGSELQLKEIFSARVAHISENEICVQVLSETHIQAIGELLLLYITETPPCGVGDYVEVTIDSNIGVDYSDPEGIHFDALTVTEKADFVLDESEILAEVTDCIESIKGGYVLNVYMFFRQGYSYRVPLTISSNEKFLIGDWIKINFAEETCFMETSPLQVDSKYVLGIEKV